MFGSVIVSDSHSELGPDGRRHTKRNVAIEARFISALLHHASLLFERGSKTLFRGLLIFRSATILSGPIRRRSFGLRVSCLFVRCVAAFLPNSVGDRHALVGLFVAGVDFAVTEDRNVRVFLADETLRGFDLLLRDGNDRN
jgi:hypothetical protein